jgi:hypothetical protein
MSAVQFIVKSIKEMSEQDREAVFAAFAMDTPVPVAVPVAASVAAAPTKTAKEPKKPRANAGKPSCHGAWTKHVLDRFSKDSVEQKEFLAARIAAAERGEMLYTKEMSKVKTGKKQVGDAMDAKDAAVGAHMAFVGWWSEQNKAEHAEFKAAWELEHPKGSGAAASTADNSDDAVTVADEDDTATSAATSAATGAATGAATSGGGSAAAVAKPEAAAKPEAKKRGPKKMADMTPEELAAAKAKRAENKAKKASANNSAEGSRASSPPKVKDD